MLQLIVIAGHWPRGYPFDSRLKTGLVAWGLRALLGHDCPSVSRADRRKDDKANRRTRASWEEVKATAQPLITISSSLQRRRTSALHPTLPVSEGFVSDYWWFYRRTRSCSPRSQSRYKLSSRSANSLLEKCDTSKQKSNYIYNLYHLKHPIKRSLFSQDSSQCGRQQQKTTQQVHTHHLLLCKYDTFLPL